MLTSIGPMEILILLALGGGVAVVMFLRSSKNRQLTEAPPRAHKDHSASAAPPNSNDQKDPTGQSVRGEQNYREKDNMGTRHETVSQAASYWMTRNVQQKFDPFVLYEFDDEKNARESLLELNCIHMAEDSGKLICTEILIYGYYKTKDGKYEALVCGEDLSGKLWEAARASFARHGGRKRNEQEPSTGTRPESSSDQQGYTEKVEFVREERREQMGHTMVYRIHIGPDAASAKAFLAQNPVTKPLYYLVVETPEGDYCRDKDGIYKE